MGRRSVRPLPAARLAQAAREMRRTTALGTLIELEIARCAVKAVAVVEELMLDKKVSAAVRLDAAREFLDRSLGKPAIRAEITATLGMAASDHDAIREQIARACASTDAALELDDLVLRQVPFSAWPQRAREIAGDIAPLLVETESKVA